MDHCGPMKHFAIHQDGKVTAILQGISLSTKRTYLEADTREELDKKIADAGLALFITIPQKLHHTYLAASSELKVTFQFVFISLSAINAATDDPSYKACKDGINGITPANQAQADFKAALLACWESR